MSNDERIRPAPDLRGLHTLYPQDIGAALNSRHEIKNTSAGFGCVLVHGDGYARVWDDDGDLRAASALNKCHRRIECDRAVAGTWERRIERVDESARTARRAL